MDSVAAACRNADPTPPVEDLRSTAQDLARASRDHHHDVAGGIGHHRSTDAVDCIPSMAVPPA